MSFTLKFIKRPKITRLTKKVNNLRQVIKPRTGLFIYVSNESVKRFKDKINNELKFLSLSAFQMILKLNREKELIRQRVFPLSLWEGKACDKNSVERGIASSSSQWSWGH